MFTVTEILQYKQNKQTYKLSHDWIDTLSLKIRTQRGLLPPTKYTVDPVAGQITFTQIPDEEDQAEVTYSYYPISVPKMFQYQRDPVLLPILLRDSVGIRSRSEAKDLSERGPRQADGTTNLISQGSIFRELNLSTGKGLSLNSGLRLQLDGTVGDNIGVTAALTDQSTPLQPEGTTQTLEEIDRVFIQLDHPNGEATFGDFTTDIQIGEFGRFSRKLEGATLSGYYKNQSGTLVGAVSKGQFRTQQIQGEEGNQGPYRLTGSDGNPEIVVLAGTETVWLNGERMIRGANQDYTIDYSTAELTFTPRRLITAESRITIDFEYAAFQYNRSIYAGKFASKLWGDRLKIEGMFASEQDDDQNPLNPVINEEVRDSLRTKGDAGATIRVNSVSPDTTGDYIAADSNGVQIYQYAGEGIGDFSIFFSRDAQGSYIRSITTTGQVFYSYNPASFRVKYSPTVRVQPPRSHRTQAIRTELRPTKRSNLQLDLASTQYDANLYSGLDDRDNVGFAGKAAGDYTLLNWGRGDAEGSVTLFGNFQHRDSQFAPLDRSNPVEFSRDWNLQQRTRNFGQMAQERAQVGISLIDDRYISSQVQWSRLDIDNRSPSLRNRQELQAQYRWLEQFRLVRDYVASGAANTRESQTARIQLGTSWLHPFITWEFQEFAGDSSVVMQQPGGGLLFTGSRGSQATVSFSEEQIRERPDTLQSRIEKSRGQIVSFSGDWRFSGKLSSRWQLTHRDRQYSTYYETQRGLRDNRYLLADWSGAIKDLDVSQFELGYNWDLLWKKEQIARREHRYIEVESGLGEYSYDSTFADYYPDPQGDYILRIVPGQDYEPVTGIQIGSQLSIDPRRRFGQNPQYWFEKIAINLRSVTRWRYEEKTRRENPAFRFGWSQITSLDSGTVQVAQLLQEDLYIFPTSPYLALRYRYQRRASLNGLDARGTETQSSSEHNLRWRATAYDPWTIEVVLGQKTLMRKSFFQSLRNRDVSEFSAEGGFGYHPSRPHIFKTTIRYQINTGTVAERSIDIALREIGEDYTYQISERGRLTTGFTWISVSDKNQSGDLQYLPYEVAGGNHIGTTLEWRVNADYRINKYLTFRLQYRGRDEPYRDTIYHQGSGEFRAIF